MTEIAGRTAFITGGAQGAKLALADLSAFLEQGVRPDDVGRVAQDAVREDRRYGHTDQMMGADDPGAAQGAADAMPRESAPASVSTAS